MERPGTEVCEAAYRAVYELAECAFDSAVSDESDPIEAVLADLENTVEAAVALRRVIQARFPIAVEGGHR